MRIIAGRYRGRTIATVKDLSIRPATDRVRTTLFDILTHRLDFTDLRVFDLFAGCGSLGLECLSRGAQHVTFVDSSGPACAQMARNAATLGCTAHTTILRTDARGFLERGGDTYGLVFADPPYAYPDTSRLPELVFRHRTLHPDGYLLIEHATNLHFAPEPGCVIGPVRTFGRTVVTFFQEGTPA